MLQKNGIDDFSLAAEGALDFKNRQICQKVIEESKKFSLKLRSKPSL